LCERIAGIVSVLSVALAVLLGLAMFTVLVFGVVWLVLGPRRQPEVGRSVARGHAEYFDEAGD
jgi:hypothetical protein